MIKCSCQPVNIGRLLFGLFLVLLDLNFVAPRSVLAQALDIDQPEITRGEREVRSVNVLNRGFPAGSSEASRTSHEVGSSYSPTDWIKLTAHLDVESVIGEPSRLDHGAIELQFELLKAGASGGIALGWVTNVQVSTDHLSTNSLIFGPIIKFSSKSVSLTLNPYFEDTFGRNDVSGLAAIYGWQGRMELGEGVAAGVEGYGKIDDVSAPPPVSQQDHRIGPAVYVWSQIDPERTISADVALLFGMTDASPNTSLKFNFGVTF